LDLPEGLVFTINQIMTTELRTLPETASLEDAIRLMAEAHIRHIPIVNTKGKLVGLVTHRDVLATTDSTLRDPDERQSPASVPLSKIMTRDVVTVDEHANLRSAALLIERHKYGCIPVVTKGNLKGIITDSDFVAVAINLIEQLEQTELDEPDVGEAELDQPDDEY
jgi:CBS domain-containing membrane protein